MQKMKQSLLSISIRSFVFFYVVSAIVIILAGFFIKNHREIEEYKQVVLWYENLSGDNPDSEKSENLKKFENFLKIKDIYQKLSSDYSNFNIIIPKGTADRIKSEEAPEEGNTATWAIGKTKENDLIVYYNNVLKSNFNKLAIQNNSNQNDNLAPRLHYH